MKLTSGVTASSLFVCLAKLATAGTIVLTFDDLPVSPCCVFVGAQVGDQYAAQGVHFALTDFGVIAGLSNGDSGNWGLEGTNGPNSDGFNFRTGYSMTLTFSTPVSGFSMDFARANSSLRTNVFTIEALSHTAGLESHTIPFGDVNQWQTVTLAEPNIYSLTFSSSSGPNGLTGAFGVDNLRFQTPDAPPPPQDTPEPGTLALVAVTLGPWMWACSFLRALTKGHGRLPPVAPLGLHAHVDRFPVGSRQCGRNVGGYIYCPLESRIRTVSETRSLRPDRRSKLNFCSEQSCWAVNQFAGKETANAASDDDPFPEFTQ
jgi:hypothetical protein